ncbi:MAG: outer membrane receptor for ferrienterochelin and colicin [Saprospiraceae bacterium]|jgi:outer membrane receptor for ferrienterochelin and colicin
MHLLNITSYIRLIAKTTFCACIIIIFVQCSSTKKESENANDMGSQSYEEGINCNQINTVDYGNIPLNLSDLLWRASGVQITGSGNDISIKVRGTQSFGQTTQPLFVIDGTPMGISYSAVNRMINPRLVKSINMLKGSAAALYGSRAYNGVISIEMKKNNQTIRFSNHFIH